MRHPRRTLLRRIAETARGGSALRRRFTAFASRQRIGFILAEFGSSGIELFELARELSIPMFCYFRGFDASSKLTDPRYRERVARMLESIDGAIAVSAFLRDQLAAHGLAHRNFRVIPSGVDLQRFRAAQKDPNLLLSVGRLVEKKSPIATIEAFAMVAAGFPDLRLEIIGEGPLHAACHERIAQLQLTRRVHLLGGRSHDFVAERMMIAPIYLQHSVTASDDDTEGLPTAIQEAMAAGAAIVSTRHAGIPEIIEHERTGLLVREHDTAAYATELQRLVSDEGLRNASRRRRSVSPQRNWMSQSSIRASRRQLSRRSHCDT